MKKINLFIIIILVSYSSIFAQTYYKILNRWKPSQYLYDGGAQLNYGNGSGDNYLWQIIDIDGTWKNIKNKATGEYVNIEGNYSYVQCYNIDPTWSSPQWQLIPVEGNWVKIQCRWVTHPDYLHVENQQGYVQHTPSDVSGWYSAEWEFVASQAAYYVAPAPTGSDNNPGTYDAPFLTLEKARDVMRGSSIKTTYIRAGTYYRTNKLLLTSADNGTVWSNYPLDGYNKAILDGTNGGNKVNILIDIEGGSNITINGIRLTNFYWHAIHNHGGTVDQRDPISQNVGSASGNQFTNNEIDHSTSTGDIAEGYYSSSCAILCDQITPNTRIANNYIHDMTSMGIEAGRSSDYAPAAGNYSGTIVENNIILKVMTIDDDGGAIYLWNPNATLCSNVTVRNNYIRDYDNSSVGDGVGIYLDEGASNTVVTGNIIGATGNGGNGVSSQAILNHGGINNWFYGNIIDLGPSAKTAAYVHVGTNTHPGGMDNNIVERNIIISKFAGNQNTYIFNQSGYTHEYAYGASGTPPAVPIVRNNIYHNYGGGQERSDSHAYTDSNPIHVDPQIFYWTYSLDGASPAYNSPVNFPSIAGGWGPPGFVVPQTGTQPSCSLLKSSGSLDTLNKESIAVLTPVNQDYNELKLFPNPNNGSFTIQIPNGLLSNEIQVYNSIGENVYSQKTFQGTQISLDLTRQPKGIYIVRIGSPGLAISRKITIK